jgi:AraC-like DNA-binding protein
MARMGRPPIELDSEQFETLCGLQCTLPEIASVLKCSEDTVERWTKRTYGMTFAEAFKKFSASGKASLRKYQFALAKKNAAMAIWLGKQILEQRDIPEVSDPDALRKAREILDGVKTAID